MIFLLSGLLLFIYGVFNFKKAFILFLVFKLVLVTNITIISVPGLPLLTLELGLTIAFIILFFLKGLKVQNAHMAYPLLIPLTFYALSLIVSSIFSVAGITSEFSNLLKSIFEDVLLVWICWQVIETKSDFAFLFKVLTIFIFISCIYGLVEYFIKDNPISAYEATLNHDPSKVIDFSYNLDERGYRINSFFEHAIAAGMTWSLYSSFVFYLFVKKKVSIRTLLFPLITAFISIFCIVLTKMRSPIIFFAITLLASVDFRSKRFYFLASCFLIGLILILLFFGNDVQNVIFALFNKSSAEEIGGSSLSMRLDQFDAAFSLMKENPLFGLGPAFSDIISNDLVTRLLGGESIWLSVITQQGLIGIFAYLTLVFFCIIYIPNKYKNMNLAIFSFAFWVTYTITSLPGFDFIFYYILIIYFVKQSRIYSLNVKKGYVYCFGLKNLTIVRGKIRKVYKYHNKNVAFHKY